MLSFFLDLRKFSVMKISIFPSQRRIKCTCEKNKLEIGDFVYCYLHQWKCVTIVNKRTMPSLILPPLLTIKQKPLVSLPKLKAKQSKKKRYSKYGFETHNACEFASKRIEGARDNRFTADSTLEVILRGICSSAICDARNICDLPG